MIQRNNVTEVLDFLSDLASPIGPEVFAGFGSDIQNELFAAIDKGEGDETIIKRWIQGREEGSLLEALVNIARTKKLDPPYDDIKNRFHENWNFHMVDLLYRVCSQDTAKAEIVIETLKGDLVSNGIGEKLEIWISEDP